MKPIGLMLCICFSFGFAEDIDTLIQKAYENSFSLKVMQKDVQINQDSVKSADSWDNPVLSAGITDVMLDDISDRSLEPMQTQFVAFSQMISLSNKKSISKTIAEDFTTLSKLRIEDKKAQIASKITLLAYQSVIIDERLKLISQKRRNLKKIKKFQRAYQQSETNLLDVDLKLLKLQNIEETLLYKKEEIKQSIEKFTVTPVLDINLSLKPKTLQPIEIEDHPKAALLKQRIILQQNKADLQKAKKTPDLKVSGGYYQRDARDDYLNLSFSIPLLIRGKEDIEISKAKLAVLRTKEELNQLKNSFEKEIKTLLKKFDSSMNIYHRFIKELIPKQRKITRLLKTKNRVGKADMIQVIKSQNLTLALRELSLDALSSHFRAYSKLRYYR